MRSASRRKCFVTGGAGFIGSNLVDRLLEDGHQVVVYDNFSTGRHAFLIEARSSPLFSLVEGDLLDANSLSSAMRGCEFVFHLAANADVRFGTRYPRKDLEQNTIATFNLLEAMRENNIKKLGFSSTGAIYGEPRIFPTPERAPLPIQTSLYGASKLACESLIQAYCEGFGFQAWIFRFVSILGERYSHGHVFDFYKKLLSDPHELKVCGDGKQRKSYLYVQECLDAILVAIEGAQEKINILNLGGDEYCTVDESIAWITEDLGLHPRLTHSGASRGWVGDNPFVFLDCSEMRLLGWRPKVSIRDAVLSTLAYLKANRWLLERP